MVAEVPWVWYNFGFTLQKMTQNVGYLWQTMFTSFLHALLSKCYIISETDVSFFTKEAVQMCRMSFVRINTFCHNHLSSSSSPTDWHIVPTGWRHSGWCVPPTPIIHTSLSNFHGFKLGLTVVKLPLALAAHCSWQKAAQVIQKNQSIPFSALHGPIFPLHCTPDLPDWL